MTNTKQAINEIVEEAIARIKAVAEKSEEWPQEDDIYFAVDISGKSDAYDWHDGILLIKM